MSEQPRPIPHRFQIACGGSWLIYDGEREGWEIMDRSTHQCLRFVPQEDWWQRRVAAMRSDGAWPVSWQI